MSEELKNKLNEFIDKIIENAEKAGNFAVEQIPDVIQQALTWFMVESLIWSSFSIPFLFIALWILRSFWKKDGWKESVYGDELMMIHAVALFFASVGLMILVVNLEWLQILVAPKWFIVSEMSKVVG